MLTSKHPSVLLPLFGLLAIVAAPAVSGQLLVWDVHGVNAAATGPLSGTAGSNVAGGTLSISPTLSASSAGDTFGASGFNRTSLQDALVDSDYLAFSIAPSAGYQLSISSITVNLGTSSATNFNVALFSSATGSFAQGDELWTYEFDTTTAPAQTITLSSVGALQTITAETSFRLYGWRDSAGTSTFRIRNLSGNDLVISGATGLAAIPEPSTYAAIFGGISLVGAILYRRRRRSG